MMEWKLTEYKRLSLASSSTSPCSQLCCLASLKLPAEVRHCPRFPQAFAPSASSKNPGVNHPIQHQALIFSMQPSPQATWSGPRQPAGEPQSSAAQYASLSMNEIIAGLQMLLDSSDCDCTEIRRLCHCVGSSRLVSIKSCAASHFPRQCHGRQTACMLFARMSVSGT